MELSCSKKIISIIKGIVSKHHGDFYFLIFFHSITTENKRESHKKLCESNDFCNVVMPFEDTKILDFDQYQKFDKATFVIYADLECFTENIDGCKNNPENSFTLKVRFFNVYNIVI